MSPTENVHRLLRQVRWLVTNRIVRNTGIYTLGNLVPQSVNVLLLPVFTRYLTTTEYGILTYTTALNVFLFVIGSLSIHSYVLRHYFDCKTEEDKRRLFGTVFVFLVVYNLILVGIEMALLPLGFNYFGIQVPFEPYVKIALLNNAIEVMTILPQVYFRVRQEAGRFVAMTLTPSLLGMGLSLYLVVYQGMGVLGRYYGLLGVNLVMLVIYLIVTVRISHLSFNPRQLKQALLFSLPLLPAAFFSNLTNMSDRFIMERYVPLPQMGVYAIGFTVGYGLSLLTNAIYKTIEPEIYRMAAESRFMDRIVELKRYLILSFLAVGCTMIALSKEAVALLAAPTFRESYRIVALVAVAMVIQGMVMPVICYLMATYQTRYVPIVDFMGAATSILSNFILIPRLGIYGAAATLIVSSLVILGSYTFITQRVTGIRWGLARDLPLIVVAFVLSYGLLQIEMPSLVISIGFKLGLIAIAVAVCARRIPNRQTI